jgi:hypothetical protein
MNQGLKEKHTNLGCSFVLCLYATTQWVYGSCAATPLVENKTGHSIDIKKIFGIAYYLVHALGVRETIFRTNFFRISTQMMHLKFGFKHI